MPSAPPVLNAASTNLSLPPTASSAAASNGMNAPVACSDGGPVLPMLSTSGPWPLVVAARILSSRSGQPITCRLTLTPVCFWTRPAPGEGRPCRSAARALVAGPVGPYGRSEEARPCPPPQAAVAATAGTAVDADETEGAVQLELDRTGQLAGRRRVVAEAVALLTYSFVVLLSMPA